jgi:hypothetical protein
MHHIALRHILELTLEVILEVVLKHVLGIKTMTSLILDHVAIAYLYLEINTREKVTSQTQIWLILNKMTKLKKRT